MRNRAVSLRYARGLIKAAGDPKQQDEVKLEIERFLRLLSSHPDFGRFLLSQSVNPFAKIEMLESLDKYLELGDISKGFIFLLIKKGRIGQLEEIFSCFQEEIDYQAGIIAAEALVAREITTSRQEQLQMKLSNLTGRRVKLKVKIAPEIIGGVIVKIGSIIYDGSIRQQFQKLKDKITEE